MGDISHSIPGRQVRLNQVILGKSCGTSLNPQLVGRDSLIDALCAFYDELNKEPLRKDNKHIASFVDKYRSTLAELRQIRVNFKDFEMKKIIGQGHFGEVRVVREKSSGDVFAMKVLKKSETLSQSNAAFFAEERDIMALASSPWLTRLYHAFQDLQHLYLVMEFHPGGDLLALLEKHRDNILPPETAHFYLAELVEAIHSLHLMGYVHRDIKPDNILIDRIGHIKLADFGSASKLNAQKTVTSRMPVGTPDYIAPEVLIAMNTVPAASASYGVECDWWSLGIVAYEMFYGQTPFSDDKVVVTYNNIMNFKTNLHFPEEPEYPEVTTSLMKALLCEATRRADYSALCQHPYFIDVDWPALRNRIPPYVPILKGEDDTSYFDEFEPEPSSPTLEIPKKEFSGKQLPFIGFTFSHPVDHPPSTRRSSLLNRSSVLHSSLYQREEDPRVASLASRLQVSQEALQRLEADRARLQETCAHLEPQVQNLQRLLEQEKSERLLLETKYQKGTRSLSDKHGKNEERLNQLLTAAQDQLEAKDKELTETKFQFRKVSSQLQDKLDQITRTSNCSKLAELHSKLEELRSRSSTSDTLLASVTASRDQLLEQYHRLKENSLDMERELLELRSVVARQEEQLGALHSHMETLAQFKEEEETDEESEEYHSLEQKNHDISLLVAKFDEEMLNKSHLEDTIKEMQTAHKDFLLENEGKLQDLEAMWTMQIQELDQELAHYKALNTSLMEELRQLHTKEAEHIRSNAMLNAKIENLELQLTIKKPLPQDSGDFEKENQSPNSAKSPQAPKIQQLPHIELPSCPELVADALTSRLDLALQDLDKLRQKMADKDAELNLLGLELKEVQREAQHSKERVETLKNMNRDLRKQTLELENKLMTASTKEEGLQTQVAELDKTIASLRNSLRDQEELYKAEKNALNDRIQFLRESNKGARELKATVARLESQNLEVTKQNQALQEQASKMDQRGQDLRKKFQELETEVVSLREKKRTMEAQIESLKTLCTDMEAQNSNMESLLTEYYERNIKLEKDRQLRDKELDSMEEEIKSLHENLVKEKKLKKNLEAVVAESEDEHASEVETLHSQLTQQQGTTASLNAQLNETVQTLALTKAECSNLAQELARAKAEGVALREETSRHITELSSLQASKLQLTQALDETLTNLEDSRAECSQLQADLDTVQADYAALQATHKVDTIRFENTSTQKTKLIDFLQAQLEEKKRWRFFGRKDTDLEWALHKQRSQNRQLRHQLGMARREEMLAMKAKTPTVSADPASRAILTALSTPTSSSASSTSGSLERMRHSIPHRFQDLLCMRPCKCAACLDSIHFGRFSSKCQDCGVMCHPKCSSQITNTCGLPPDLMKYFRESMRKPREPRTPDSLSLASSSATGQSVDEPLLSGWVKILVTKKGGKKAWEQRFLRVEAADATLHISSGAAVEEEEEKLYLQPIDGEVMVLSATGNSTLANTLPAEDIALVFKLEWLYHDQPLPSRVLYVMAPSPDSKSSWVGCLEALVQTVELDEAVSGHLLLTLKDSSCLDLSYVLALPGDMAPLVGSQEGLFQLREGQLEHLPDVGGAVHALHLVPSLQLVLLVMGDRRELYSADPVSLHLLSPVLLLSNCHLLASALLPSGHTYLAVATPTSVYLLLWTNESFSIKKEVQCQEVPCSCLHFTHNTLILGLSTYMELDLKTLLMDEFLDMGDTSLSYLHYGAAQLHSFPINLFQVSSRPQEFLLCYPEFGVFVDSLGRRSRDGDLKWIRLPLCFAFRQPYLFVLHHNCVEVMEIMAQGAGQPASTFLKVPSPRYLGNGSPAEQAIFLSCHPAPRTAHLLLLPGDLNPPRLSEEEEAGEEFTFTSSLDESLTKEPAL